MRIKIVLYSRFPHIALFASKAIKKGDVLGFDYGEKFWVIKHKFFTCWCGGDKCKYSKTAISKTLETYYKNLEDEAEKQSSSTKGGRLKLKLRMEEGKVVKVDDSGLLPDEPDIERRTPKLDEPRKSKTDDGRRSPKREDRKSLKLEEMKPARQETPSPSLMDSKSIKQEVIKMEVDPEGISKEVKQEKRTAGGEAIEIKKKKRESRLSVESKLWKGLPPAGDPASPAVVVPKAPKAIVKEIAKTQKLIDGLVDEIVSLTQAKNGDSMPSDVVAARAAVLKGLTSSSSGISSPRVVYTPPPPAVTAKPSELLRTVVCSENAAAIASTAVAVPPKAAPLPAAQVRAAVVPPASLVEDQRITNGHTAEESPATTKRGRGRPKKVEVEKGKKLVAVVVEVTSPAMKPVVTSPALVPVVTSPALKPVVTSTAMKPVVTSPAITPVVTSPAMKPVVTSPAMKPVVTSPVIKPVVTSPNMKPVVTIEPLVIEPPITCEPSALASAAVSGDSRPSTPGQGDSLGRPRRQRKLVEKDL